MAYRILLINGPNLNMLGIREPEVYGNTTLSDVVAQVEEKAKSLGVELLSYQSNHEGELIDFIQQHYGACDGVIINPGGFTHTSVALRDALLGLGKPVIEVHLSNIYAREEFRHRSLISDIATGGVFGLGKKGYELALAAMVETVRG